MYPALAFCRATRDGPQLNPDMGRIPRIEESTERRPLKDTMRRHFAFSIFVRRPKCAIAAFVIQAAFASCRPAEKPNAGTDPYLVRIEYAERKLDELRETTDRRFQDERVRRENQLAVQDRTLREVQQQLAQLENKYSDLSNRLWELQITLSNRVQRTAISSTPAFPPASLINTSQPQPVALGPQSPKPPDISFPVVITDISSFVVPVRTQASVRVVETGKMVRDDSGRRVPELKTETYPIYEYEYRVRFTASNRSEGAVSLEVEAGYGPLVFNLAAGDLLTGKEIRWKPGASLLMRTENQYRLFPVPPPPPP